MGMRVGGGGVSPAVDPAAYFEDVARGLGRDARQALIFAAFYVGIGGMQLLFALVTVSAVPWAAPVLMTAMFAVSSGYVIRWRRLRVRRRALLAQCAEWRASARTSAARTQP